MRRVLWVDDTSHYISVAEIVELCQWVHAELKNANVLVHCAQGKSRSALVVVAYTMVMRNVRASFLHVQGILIPCMQMSPVDALTKVVRPLRQIAEPNPGFMRRLDAFHTSPEFARLRTELAADSPAATTAHSLGAV